MLHNMIMMAYPSAQETIEYTESTEAGSFTANASPSPSTATSGIRFTANRNCKLKSVRYNTAQLSSTIGSPNRLILEYYNGSTWVLVHTTSDFAVAAASEYDIPLEYNLISGTQYRLLREKTGSSNSSARGISASLPYNSGKITVTHGDKGGTPPTTTAQVFNFPYLIIE